MNYYKHHIGDYAAATAHLSWDEDMAYTRLIRAYYQHARPIPAELANACRLIRATSPAHRRAVEAVLNEFFSLEADGWHQKRCDAELQRAAEKSEQNRMIGRKGGRPNKSESETVFEENPDGFYEETGKVSKRTQATSHKPIANSHLGSSEPRASAGAAPKIEVPDWMPAEAWQGFVQMRARIRKPLTDRAKTLAIAELSKLRAEGHDPAAVLDQSTLNSWQGLFALKATPITAGQRPGVHIGQQTFGQGWGK